MAPQTKKLRITLDTTFSFTPTSDPLTNLVSSNFKQYPELSCFSPRPLPAPTHPDPYPTTVLPGLLQQSFNWSSQFFAFCLITISNQSVFAKNNIWSFSAPNVPTASLPHRSQGNSWLHVTSTSSSTSPFQPHWCPCSLLNIPAF